MCLLVFLASSAFLFYVLFGYPLLLGLLARVRARPVQKQFLPRTVTLLLPVYNGCEFIRAKLESVLALHYPRELLQIVVVSDGSNDGTDEIVKQFCRSHDSIELLSEPHGGKALALNAGLDRARGEILFFTDVRQALDSDCLERLVACFTDPEIGVASGELVIRDDKSFHRTGVGLYRRYENWIRKKQSSLDSVTGATGCIYAMRRHLARPFPPDCLLDDVYQPMQAVLAGYRVIMEERALAYDFPTSFESEFYRKVRTLAGVYQLLIRVPALLGPANRTWFHFFSHKIGRLLAPFALLTIAGSSFCLPMPWAAVALGGQAILYALAALDPLLGERGRVKHFSLLLRTFVVLMVASLCAVSILFRPSGEFWKKTEV